MRSKALALSVRALRVDSRSPSGYIGRSVLVIVLLGALWIAFETRTRVGAAGLQLFQSVVWIDFFLICILGTSAFSGVVTEEKETATLGLLKLAGMTPLSILLGKSVSQLLTAGLLLGVQVPFMQLSVALGGVSSDQVLGAYTLLGSFTLLVYGLAVLSSTVAARTAGAARLVVVLLLLLLVGPWIAYGLSEWFKEEGWIASNGTLIGWVDGVISIFTNGSTTTGLSRLVSTGVEYELFSSSVQLNLVIAAASFLLAWSVFERFNRNEVGSAPARPKFGFDARRETKRVKGRNALFWKDAEFVAGGRAGMIGRFVLYGLGVMVFVAIAVLNRQSVTPRQLGGILMFIGLIGVVVEAAVLASRSFHDEVQAKTWSSLMLLPLDLRQIVTSKVLGGLWFVVPSLTLLGLGALFNPRDFFDAIDEGFFDSTVGYYLVGLFVFSLHTCVWFSLRMRRGALGATIASIVVGHFVFGTCCASAMPSSGSAEALLVMLAIGFVALSFAFQFQIGLKLRELAADD